MKRFFEGVHWGFRIFSVNEEIGHNAYSPVRYEVCERGKVVAEFKTRGEAESYCAHEATERLSRKGRSR